MNWWLLAASLLVLGSALAHSLLGEKVVLRRVYRQAHEEHAGQNRRASDDPLTRQTLRLAWHSLTIALVGFAGVMLVGAIGNYSTSGGWGWAMQIASITFAGMSILSLAIAKGRHIGWMWFAAVAVATWMSVG